MDAIATVPWKADRVLPARARPNQCTDWHFVLLRDSRRRKHAGRAQDARRRAKHLCHAAAIVFRRRGCCGCPVLPGIIELELLVRSLASAVPIPSRLDLAGTLALCRGVPLPW